MKKIILLASLALMTSATYGQVSRADAEGKVTEYLDAENIDKKPNVFIKGRTIHLFMDQDGNLLLKGYPTTATDKNTFIVHLIKSENNKTVYTFEADGKYVSGLNIEGVAGLTDGLEQIDFPEVGPFTGDVKFIIKRGTGKDAEILNEHTITTAKTIHASVGSGFVYSTLKNPANIRVVPLSDGSEESTLLADNPQGNATLALMATLYPWGRNSLKMTSPSLRDRMGIAVGTTIASSQKNFKNLYLGLQYDFAVGGSIVAGVDIAERQKILGIDYKEFVFGETVFSGEIEDLLYQKVGAGFFIGVQVDSRILSRMFASNP